VQECKKTLRDCRSIIRNSGNSHLFELLRLLLPIINEAVSKQYSNTKVFRILQLVDKLINLITIMITSCIIHKRANEL